MMHIITAALLGLAVGGDTAAPGGSASPRDGRTHAGRKAREGFAENREELRKERVEMEDWWCTQDGKMDTLPCIARKMRDASPDERKEMREAMREKMRGDATDGATKMQNKLASHDDMHEAWCKTHGETTMCRKWAENRDKRLKGQAEGFPGMKEKFEAMGGKPSADKRRAEIDSMHEAYCTSEHADEAPCLMWSMRKTAPRSVEHEALHAKLKMLEPETNKEQDAAMHEFWCNDPQVDRDEKGICLSWKLRRDKKLRMKEELKEKEVADDKAAADAGVDPAVTKRRKFGEAMRESMGSKGAKVFKEELDRVHEWYCTSHSAETEESEPCIRWRVNLKTTSAEERTRLTELRKKLASEKQAALREASEKMRTAKQGDDKEAITKAEQELRELREHGRAAFNEMRRAYCEEGEGKGKTDEESPVCMRWRAETTKGEL